MDQKVRIGVAAMVRKGDMFLLGKRKGSLGEGTWAFPGGHLEFGESFEDCVKREILEETSLHVNNITFAAVTNDIFISENKHYITVFMLCDYIKGEAKILEPQKCEKWEWFVWDNLPQPVFLPLQSLLKQGYKPK